LKQSLEGDVTILSWTAKQEAFKKDICEILVRIGALKFGAFPLSDDRWSTYYIDLRLIPSVPGAFRRVGDVYVELARNVLDPVTFYRVAGIPTAGIPFASLLSFFLAKPFLYVRKEPAIRGRERRVEGLLHPGDSVLLVDDLVASGQSLLTAANAIAAEGGVVHDALVLIDRQEGGKKALARAGIRLHSLAKMSELAQILYDLEAIDGDQLKGILKQIQ
jgi:orotate phosphoribosyltransferase